MTPSGGGSQAATLAALAAVAVAAALFSLASGAYPVTLGEAAAALVAPDGSTAHLVVRAERLPRAAAGLAAGGALGAAGAILQTLARNPLASPSLLGVSAGAALAVVGLGIAWAGPPPSAAIAAAALAGGALAGGTTVVLASADGRGAASGATPLRLILAGAAVGLFLSALSAGLLILDQRALDDLRLWLAGSLAGRPPDLVAALAPAALLVTAASALLGRRLSVLALGPSSAAALGVDVGRTRVLAAVVSIALTGLAVALAGPVAFIGLASPHLARGLVGASAERILPAAALIGAALLTFADAAGRLAARPAELPVGVVTVLIGAPVFIALL
ncbi:MAG: iron ABC transporter permease, partial [Pseudomonadota bacterium]